MDEIIRKLKRESLDLEQMKGEVLKDPSLLPALLSGIKTKDDKFRYNSFQILQLICREKPEFLYPKWEYFVELLNSTNSYHRIIGATIIARLTPVDKDEKFTAIFDNFFQLYYDKSIIVARKLVENITIIIKAKPNLRSEIIHILLTVDQTDHKQKELLKFDIVKVLKEVFQLAESKEELYSFVEKQIDSSSPKTRKAARHFMQEYHLI